MTEDPVPVPAMIHTVDDIGIILMVSGMIEYRNQMIVTFLDRFEQGSDKLHRERRTRVLQRKAENLVKVADRIHELAQDNSYDVRNLMAHLEHRQEQRGRTRGDSGHDSQVGYIQ